MRMGKHLGTTALTLLVGMVHHAGPIHADTLRIGVASSLREVVVSMLPGFEEAAPETQVRVSYGASSVLAAQLRAGAPLDVLLLADPRIADALEEQIGLADRQRFARNRLIVLARDSEIEIPTPDALGSAQIRRIAIPPEAVPVGRYAREWLRGHKLLEALTERAVQTEHARATLVAVDQGHVDAAIVYETEAALARHAVVAYRIPEAEQPRIEYVAVQSPSAANAELAQRWLAFMTGAQARETLEKAGFLGPGPERP